MALTITRSDTGAIVTSGGTINVALGTTLTLTAVSDNGHKWISGSNNDSVFTLAEGSGAFLSVDSVTIIPVAVGTSGNQLYCYENSGGETFGVYVRVTSGSSGSVSVTGVSVYPGSLSLSIGQTYTLDATVYPTNATDQSVYWVSGNSSVASVGYSSGLVTARAAGTATIRVYTNDGDYTDYCTVTVTSSSVAVTGVTVSPSTLNLAVGQTSRLTAAVIPTNATNQSVSWSSTSSSVASVDSSGLVTANAAGNATIKATTSDGNYVDTCVVTVSAASSSEGCGLYLDCINYAESTYDYGLVSNIGQTLSTSASQDGATGSTKVKRNFSGSQSASVQTVEYGTIGVGTHVIYAKYLKDQSVDSNNDSLKFKVRLVTDSGYTASYTVSDVSGASYGFSLTSDGYYTSENAGVSSSAALCKITITVTENSSGSDGDYAIYFDCINYAEANFDYGILSNIGCTLLMSNTDDSNSYSSNVKHNFKGSSMSTVQTVPYGSYGAGTYVIYVKFRKDGSVNNNNDSLKFKVRIVNNGSGTAEASYTVEDISGSTYGFSLTSDGYYTSENGSVNSSYAICKVTITIPSSAPAYPVSATVTPSTAVVMINNSITLTATITMSDGTKLPSSGMTWSSSNDSIASVSGGVVSTTNSAGVVTITVSASSDSSVSASCTLTIISIILNRTDDSLNVNVSQTITITATVYPTSLSNRYVVFELIQNNEVLTVLDNSMNEGGTYDTNGSIRLCAAELGTCTLRIRPVYYTSIYKDFVITVGGELITNITIPVYRRYLPCTRTDLDAPVITTIMPSITPETATNKVLNWTLTTDDSDSIRLVSTSGTYCSLYCWHTGRGTLTAAATDGSGVTASLVIYVVPAPFIYTNNEWVEATAYICNSDGVYSETDYCAVYPNLPPA